MIDEDNNRNSIRITTGTVGTNNINALGAGNPHMIDGELNEENNNKKNINNNINNKKEKKNLERKKNMKILVNIQTSMLLQVLKI